MWFPPRSELSSATAVAAETAEQFNKTDNPSSVQNRRIGEVTRLKTADIKKKDPGRFVSTIDFIPAVAAPELVLFDHFQHY